MDDAEIQIADYFETVTIDKASGSYYKLRDWIAKALKEEKESTLAERTEQCAKIAEMNDPLKAGPYIAAKIRALNQPENKS